MIKIDIDKLKNLVKVEKYILMENTSFEEYVEDLKEELEDCKNILSGSDGEIPERVIKLISPDGVLMTLKGRNDVLKSGWDEEKENGKEKLQGNDKT